jgi:hypothetical protein
VDTIDIHRRQMKFIGNAFDFNRLVEAGKAALRTAEQKGDSTTLISVVMDAPPPEEQ